MMMTMMVCLLKENRERLESRGVEVKTENKAYESGIYGFVRSEAEGGPAVNAGESTCIVCCFVRWFVRSNFCRPFYDKKVN